MLVDYKQLSERDGSPLQLSACMTIGNVIPPHRTAALFTWWWLFRQTLSTMMTSIRPLLVAHFFSLPTHIVDERRRQCRLLTILSRFIFFFFFVSTCPAMTIKVVVSDCVCEIGAEKSQFQVP